MPETPNPRCRGFGHAATVKRYDANANEERQVSPFYRNVRRAHRPRLHDHADGPSRPGRSTGRLCSRQSPLDTHDVSSVSSGDGWTARFAPAGVHAAPQPLGEPGGGSWNTDHPPLRVQQRGRREPRRVPKRVAREAEPPSTPDRQPTTMHESWSSYRPRLGDGGTAPARNARLMPVPKYLLDIRKRKFA